MVGQRLAGEKIGEYRMTRNVNNPGFAPGPYQRVVVHGDETDDPPLRVHVHDGHSGGPVLYFGSSVVIMTV